MYAIYALIDPRDYTVHYVGQTTDVYKRFSEHVNGNSGNFIKTGWIAELRTLNKMVIMETLEEVEDHERALQREGYWIKHFRVLSEPLANATHRAAIKKVKTVRLGARSGAEVAPSPLLIPVVTPDFEKPEVPDSSGFLSRKDDYLLTKLQAELLITFYMSCSNVNKSLEQIRDEKGRGLGGRYTRHASYLLEHAGLKKRRA